MEPPTSHKPVSEPEPITGKVLPPLTKSTLYLVATPIGNLEDITLRAIRVLKECDWIAAEDTRHTGILLKHLGISKPMLSCHGFNEARRTAEIMEKLHQGSIIALVSDAGSPGISDPGERLVKAAISRNIRVESVPGPCAAIAAISASGLDSSEFHFVGFLPHKSAQRLRKLESLVPAPGTLVFYESPYRIDKLLQELCQVFPKSGVVIAKELTKKFERFWYGDPEELLERLRSNPAKGEYVVLVERTTTES